MDPYDELLEEPLFIDGIAIRRWSDLSRVPRPRQAPPDGFGTSLIDPESDGTPPP